MALALDLTGSLTANKVVNEAHSVSLEISRFIVPKEGAFYSNKLVVRNTATGLPLRPILDYALYEPVEEIWKRLGVGAYKIIHVYNETVVAVRLEYQAIGGEYQYTAENLEKEIGDLLASGSKTLPFGHVSGMPLGGLPPEMHFEDAHETYDAGKVVLALNHMVDSLNTGDRLGLSQVYQYIADSADDYHQKAMDLINAMNSRLDNLEDILDQGVGDIIISDNPTPPHVRLGYGQFQIMPDVLLMGNNPASQVGDLVGLASGNDWFARRTWFWRQVEDMGQVSYALTKSATTIDEGKSVTFILQTTGLAPGTNVPYRIAGTAGFNANDIAGTPLNGFFTIGADGSGQVVVTAAEDNSTEGNESFTLTVTATANVSETVTIKDTSRSPSIALRFSAAANGAGTITQIDEGQTAYLVIESTSIPPGHVLNLTYAASSSQSDDFDGDRPSTVVINDVTTIVPYAVRADRRDDGNRTLVPSITSSIITAPISTSLTIRDTSKAPTYQMWFSREATGTAIATSIDEGQRVYLHIQTTEVDVGTVLNLQYVGQATADDFNDPRPTTATIGVGGKVVIEYYTKNDFTSEGDETFGVNLMQDASILRSTNILILDTSANPNYVLGFYADANGTTSREVANEGDTVYLVLKTQNVAAGTQFSIVTNPGNTTASAADFSTAIPTRLTIGSDGKGAAALSIRNDYLGEGVEMLQLIAKDSGDVQIGTATLVINDTSVNSSATASWSSSTAGTPVITQANEGATVYLHFTGTNMPPSAKIDLTYPTGNGITSADDFAVQRPSNVTLNSSGRGYISYTLKNDMLREGDEVFQVVARFGETELGSYALTIKDTSVPTLDIKASSTEQGAGTLTQVDEGMLFYLYIQGQGFPTGQSLKVQYSGVAAADFEILPGANVQLNAEFRAVVPIKIKENMKTDGLRTLTLNVTDSNDVLLRTLSLTVNDSSKTPTYSMVWSTSPSGVPAITNASLDDGNVYLVVSTTNIPDGTQLTLNRKGSEYNPADYLVPVRSVETITVNNNRAVLEVNTASRNANISIGFVNELTLPITQASEGDEIYLAITTRWNGPGDESQWNVGGAKKFYIRQKVGTGYADANDLGTILPAYLSWGGASGQASPQVDKLKIRLKLDGVVEGTEKLAIEVNEYSDFRDEGAYGTAMLDLLDLTNAEEIITINSWSKTTAMDLLTYYIEAKGRPTKPVNVRFIIGASVTIIGTQIGGGASCPAILSGIGWPEGSNLYVENLGKVYGGGGTGSKSVFEAFDGFSVGFRDWARRISSTAPTDGFPAIENQMTNDVMLYVINKGIMMSGGGGGGRGEDLVWGDGTLYRNLNVPGSAPLDLRTMRGCEGSGGSYGGNRGKVTWLNDIVALGWVYGFDGRDNNTVAIGAPSERVRYLQDYGTDIKKGDPFVLHANRRDDMRAIYVCPGAGGKGGDAGMDGSPGCVVTESLTEFKPTANMTPSTLTACAGGKAGYMTSGNVIFTNQGGTVRSRDYQ